MELFDSHSHIDVAAFDADRDAVVARARAAGVARQLVPAVTAEGWSELRRVCAESPGLHPAYGLHPMYLEAHDPGHLVELEQWLARERPVAVGECGLDFYAANLDRDRQYAYLMPQLELARERDLPVVLHARRAVDEITAAIRRVGGLTGVVHSFSGSAQQARKLFDLGFCIGIGGPVTYERATRLRGTVARMPLEFLLLETDSPDQPLATRRGERNEPAALREVCECVAALRGTTAAEIAAATTANAERVFLASRQELSDEAR